MGGMFFTSWQLWQEMTFVLAMAIVAVFCAGLGKLWWNNRLMRKQEVLDEEKRARTEEMRKTGLPLKRGNNVPFGVRAIQNGIEVDGIWISRPASLNEVASAKLASSTTLAAQDSDSQRKGGREDSEDEKSVLVTTTYLGPKQSPSTASIFQKLTDSDSIKSGHSGATPVSQFAHGRTRGRSSRPTGGGGGGLNEDTLRKLECQAPARPPSHHAYAAPPGSPCSPHQRAPRGGGPTSERSSASSSGESVDSRPRSASGRSYTSSSQHSSRLLYMARNNMAHGGEPASFRRCSEKDGQENPFEAPTLTPTPARTPSGFSVLSRTETSVTRLPQDQEGVVSAPEPTFGPGELHYNSNRTPRSVVDGFERVPDGILGSSGGVESLEKYERSGRAPRSRDGLPMSSGHAEVDNGRKTRALPLESQRGSLLPQFKSP